MLAPGVYDLLLGRRDLAALAALRDSLAEQVARIRTSSRERAAAAAIALPLPPSSYFGTFTNASLGSLALEGNASTLVVRLGDSWSLARGVAAADGTPVRDTLAANVLGGEQRLALRFAPDGGRLQQVTVRDFVFRRVEPAEKRKASRVGK